MNIEIYANRTVYKEDKEETQEENRADSIKLTNYPEELKDYNKYIEFETEDGKVVDLILEDKYELKSNITQYEEVDAQIVFKKTLEDDDTAVWKSKIFTLKFFDSINAIQIVTEKQVDLINTLVDTLNVEISKVEQLEVDVQELIADIEARLEAGEFKGEKGDKGDTPIRGIDYWTEADKQEVIQEATTSIDGKLEEYNQNATTKTTEYNTNATNKTGEYNTNATSKVEAYDQNATEKLAEYNSNATTKVTDYNDNATGKLSQYNTNSATKIEQFDSNATEKLQQYNLNADTKTTAYNQNAENKTTTFNTNATTKVNVYNSNTESKMVEYNTNATTKIEEYNNNAETKIEEYDEHVSELTQTIEDIEAEQTEQNKLISELQEENTNLLNALPSITGEGDYIELEGTSKNKFKKFEIEGKTEQAQYVGKNLFDKNNIISGKYVVYNTGNLVTNSSFFTTDYIEISGGTNYYISGCGNIHVAFFNDNKEYTSGVYGTGLMTPPEEAKYIRFSPLLTVIDKVQFEEGTTATDYEPYCDKIPSPNSKFPQPIKNVVGNIENKISNKNKFDGNFVKRYINQNTGVITPYEMANYRASENYIKLKANTSYIISRQDESKGIIAYYYEENEDFISSRADSQASVHVTSIFNRDVLLKFVLMNCIDSNEYTSMLEEGTTATPYVEHEEQNLPFTLEEGQFLGDGDYLADDGIHKNVAQYVITGQGNWEMFNNKCVRIEKNDVKGNETSDVGNIKCNYLIGNSQYNLQVGNVDYGISTRTSSIKGIVIRNKECTTLEEYIQWFKQLYNNGTPLIVEYELAEEEIIPYNATQQAQYNAIKKATSYTGKTYIQSTSDELSPNLKVEAVADMNNKIQILESKIALLEG